MTKHNITVIFLYYVIYSFHLGSLKLCQSIYCFFTLTKHNNTVTNLYPRQSLSFFFLGWGYLPANSQSYYESNVHYHGYNWKDDKAESVQNCRHVDPRQWWINWLGCTSDVCYAITSNCDLRWRHSAGLTALIGATVTCESGCEACDNQNGGRTLRVTFTMVHNDQAYRK